MFSNDSYSLVDVGVLQLHEASADGSDVALLAAERHSTRSFRVLQLWIGVDSSVAHTAVQTVHDHRQLNWK